MIDKQFFEQTEASSLVETLPVTVRGYTLRRRLAISAWLLMLAACVAYTYTCFALYSAGVEYFHEVIDKTYSNLELGSQSHRIIIIPLVSWGRYLGFAGCILLGIMALKAILIQPILRTRYVRVSTSAAEGPEAR